MAPGERELQARGLPPGTDPDTWNLTHPEEVEAVARAYAEAGSQIILTNTFRANAVAMHGVAEADLDAINRAGVAHLAPRRGSGAGLCLHRPHRQDAALRRDRAAKRSPRPLPRRLDPSPAAGADALADRNHERH